MEIACMTCSFLIDKIIDMDENERKRCFSFKEKCGTGRYVYIKSG